jgi:hypothetical protein
MISSHLSLSFLVPPSKQPRALHWACAWWCDRDERRAHALPVHAPCARACAGFVPASGVRGPRACRSAAPRGACCPPARLPVPGPGPGSDCAAHAASGAKAVRGCVQNWPFWSTSPRPLLDLARAQIAGRDSVDSGSPLPGCHYDPAASPLLQWANDLVFSLGWNKIHILPLALILFD